MRFKGFLSPAQAAARLRVCRQTVQLWAHQSLEADEDDDDVKLHGVTQTAAGRLLIPLEEVERLTPRRGR
jgi:hypothetical protein